MEAGAITSVNPERARVQLSHFWPNIAVVNTPSSGVSDAEVESWVNAVSKQVVYHFGPLWHTYADLNFFPSATKMPSGMWVVSILSDSDTAGALGYHDLTPDGFPLGKIFAATDRQYGLSSSVTFSHELMEMLGDPFIDLSAQASNGVFYAYEACDACEGDQYGYKIDGVLVSDFVTPSWFDEVALQKYDFEGHISQPLEIIADGYISVFDPSTGQGWKQLTAEKTSNLRDLGGSALRPPKSHEIPRIGSRRERRFRGRQNWNLSTYPI